MTRRTSSKTPAPPGPTHVASVICKRRFRLWQFSFAGRVNNRDLERYILEYRHRHPDGLQAALKCWQSPWHMHRRTTTLDRLIRLIERAATAALEVVRKKRTTRLRVTECWAAVYEKGDSAPLHDHGIAHYSGVYYVSAIPDHPSVAFEDRYSINPIPGTFVLFDGAYAHRVPRVRSAEPRIIVAVNILRVPKYLIPTERRLRGA